MNFKQTLLIDDNSENKLHIQHIVSTVNQLNQNLVLRKL